MIDSQYIPLVHFDYCQVTGSLMCTANHYKHIMICNLIVSVRASVVNVERSLYGMDKILMDMKDISQVKGIEPLILVLETNILPLELLLIFKSYPSIHISCFS